MASIEFKGVEGFIDALTKEASLESKKKAVHKHGESLNKKAVRKAVFNGHMEWEKGKGYVFTKPTGYTKKKIKIEKQLGGLIARVHASSEYSGYLEVGTRFMSAQPFVKPAMEEVVPQFLADLARAEQ